MVGCFAWVPQVSLPLRDLGTGAATVAPRVIWDLRTNPSFNSCKECRTETSMTWEQARTDVALPGLAKRDLGHPAFGKDLRIDK